MITFYIINQPESTWMKEDRCEGSSDTSLTKLGKAQATKIARFYAQKQIDGIITSRLHRAIQCAKILQQFIPHKPIRDERLNEINLGVWHGKFPEELESRYPDIWQKWRQDPLRADIPEAEKVSEIQTRLISFINEYTENTLFPKYYLINTHDIISRILISSITGEPLAKMWETQLTPGGVSEVEIYPEKKLVQLNNTDHLNV